ncbi:MAG: 50S ribosomal protein L5 [Actinobacteria bacterium]|nr:50S ribosomal protein L5 [Actinomycetota bacterium]
MARLKDQFEKEFLTQLQEELKLSNPMEVPRVSKICVNMGVGEAKTDAKLLDDAVAEMTIITGQKPKLTRARKSIANFKLREGMAVGCTVTLRGARMYEFLDRLIAIALPRIRDFRGIKRKSFDGRGNMSLGIKEQIIFPEIDYDSITQTRGMDITITTTARNDDEGRALLTKLGMPFRER